MQCRGIKEAAWSIGIRCHPGFHITSNCTRCQFRKLSEPFDIASFPGPGVPDFFLREKKEKGGKKKGDSTFSVEEISFWHYEIDRVDQLRRKRPRLELP
jgi:hypothetical protein